MSLSIKLILQLWSLALVFATARASLLISHADISQFWQFVAIDIGMHPDPVRRIRKNHHAEN